MARASKPFDRHVASDRDLSIHIKRAYLPAQHWQKVDLERDKNLVAKQNLTEGADEIFVNGDSFILNARVLEPIFKARMFSEVQA